MVGDRGTSGWGRRKVGSKCRRHKGVEEGGKLV